jgi:uncharacterized protein YndB with AHSA1/START domain
MLKKILVVVVALLAAAAVVVAMQPGTYRVVRSATINAPPAAVFGMINDFHKWEAWSPWGKMDPAMKVAYSGAPLGTGALYEWSGNRDVGKGRMSISESRPDEHIRIKLEFIEPFPSEADNEFALTPAGGSTKVDWSMSGNHNFLSKAMCLVTGGMDKMIGPDFEKGLAQLKIAAESAK